MTATEILAAHDPRALFGDDVAAGYRRLAKEWHPDRNSAAEARKVFEHLTHLRDLATGAAFTKVAIPGGALLYRTDRIDLVSDAADAVPTAAVLKALAAASSDLSRRIPGVQSDPIDFATLTLIRPPTRTVSMQTVREAYPTGLPAEHVAWVVSRLYEVLVRSHLDAKVACCGVTPESCLVMVKEHGVIPLDWRFATPVGMRLSRVPRPLVNLVPADKRASFAFDVACVNQTAIILLGDPSGIGNVLLRRDKSLPEIPKPFLDWFRSASVTDPLDHYKAYRKMLESTYGKPSYHELNV